MPITPTTTTNVELSSSSTVCAESTQIHKNDVNNTTVNVAVTADKKSALPLILQSPQHNIKVSIVADVGGGCNVGAAGGGSCGTVTATTLSISNSATVATNTTTTTVCKRRFSSTTITTDIISTNNVDEQKQTHAEVSQPPQQQRLEPTNSNGSNSNSGINSIGVSSDVNVPTAAAAPAADGVMVKNIAKEEKVSQQQQHQEKATNVVNAKNISIVSESAGITLNRYDTLF